MATTECTSTKCQEFESRQFIGSCHTVDENELLSFSSLKYLSGITNMTNTAVHLIDNYSKRFLIYEVVNQKFANVV